MRWTPGGVSGNIEDQRSSGGGGLGGGGMKVGLGGILVAGVLSLIFGRDFVTPMLNSGDPAPARSSAEVQERNRAEEPRVQFVSFVLDDAQETWHRVLGPRYRDAKLVLFRDGVRSGCGAASAQAGPFYCPEDQKVYVDLSFFDELDQRFGAPGDFAQAYVLAHELGHHVQTLLGVSSKVRQAQESLHTLVDGFALGAASGEERLGLLVFLAILAHKVPSSFSLSAILRAEGYSRGRALAMNAIFALMVPLGAAIFVAVRELVHADRHVARARRQRGDVPAPRPVRHHPRPPPARRVAAAAVGAAAARHRGDVGAAARARA